MSRRNAAVAGLIAWLVALLFAPEKTPRSMAIWAVVAAVVVTLSVVGGRLLSREIRRAAERGDQ